MATSPPPTVFLSPGFTIYFLKIFHSGRCCSKEQSAGPGSFVACWLPCHLSLDDWLRLIFSREKDNLSSTVRSVGRARASPSQPIRLCKRRQIGRNYFWRDIFERVNWVANLRAISLFTVKPSPAGGGLTGLTFPSAPLRDSHYLEEGLLLLLQQLQLVNTPLSIHVTPLY